MGREAPVFSSSATLEGIAFPAPWTWPVPVLVRERLRFLAGLNPIICPSSPPSVILSIARVFGHGILGFLRPPSASRRAPRPPTHAVFPPHCRQKSTAIRPHASPVSCPYWFLLPGHVRQVVLSRYIEKRRFFLFSSFFLLRSGFALLRRKSFFFFGAAGPLPCKSQARGVLFLCSFLPFLIRID